MGIQKPGHYTMASNHSQQMARTRTRCTIHNITTPLLLFLLPTSTILNNIANSSNLIKILLLLLTISQLPTLINTEYVHNLEISENVPIGTRIGFIGDGASTTDSGPPYLIVPVPGSAVDSDLSIDSSTGEIRTKVQLDRETRPSYSLVAIPISGANVRVVVNVLDENDNAPTFPTSVMYIEFPENTPRDVKRTLHPAKDPDLEPYNTQKYNILSGNVNNAFRLSSHRERDGVLYLDLQINGFLDRETIDSYSLVIEALDGGIPPLRGEMTVNITIQDINDNQPIFNQSRYFATIPENSTVGTSVLQVFATDIDSGDNGYIEYSINRRQSDRDNMFKIDAVTGLVVVNKPLDFETKELHELVIVAKDHGLQPLETTAFVSIRVTDVNDNQPTINVIFLSDDATPKISESAQPGEFVARISVNDPDSKTEYSNINVTLLGGEGHFGLTTRDNIIYLMIVSLPLDREIQPNYTLSVVATDTGTPPLHASRTIHLQVTDINDNAPEFDQQEYHANVMEVSDPGTSVIQVSAIDRDEGNNSALIYSLLDTPDSHSSWFQIDPRTGLITTRAHVDCETDPVPQLTVIATDSGYPPLSSSTTVLVTIHDVNDNEPIFDQSFYNVSVPENEPKGRCFLKVSATDPDCGVNAMVNYTLGERFGHLHEFEVRSGTGEVCIAAELDFEARANYEFPIIATDRGGLSTTAMVKIQLTDVNDNRPIFYPREYNVSLREGGVSSSATNPVVVVVATDADSGRFGQVQYRIVSGNEANLFRIERNTGEIFVSRPSLLSTRTQPYHHLNISATDGAGLRAISDAEVFISVIDSAQRPPIFEKARYTYQVKEDAKLNTIVGSVKATNTDSGFRGSVRYSIYSGDPDGYFSIDSETGTLRTASILDHETHATVLLNVQAMSGEPPAYGHTQVNIVIEDVNDNSPEFESNTVRISVPENVDIGGLIYAAHAHDRDSGHNGLVRYRIASNSGGHNTGSNNIFAIDSQNGHLTLTRHLDYETSQRHSLIITATDMGTPPLSANLSVLVEVQDVNDNPPTFERNEYSVKILESLPINSQILQVTAVDLDTGNNARLTYRLIIENSTTNQYIDDNDLFGIFPNSGLLYLKDNLDRETRDRYDLTIAAMDNGTPSLTATTHVIIIVLDANDNDPKFLRDKYEFQIEENLRRGAYVGTLTSTDADMGMNAVIRFTLIPSNTSFQVNPVTGEIVTREPLDRETKEIYDLVAEARDQGTPARSTRVAVRVQVTDVNDNAPELVDPQEDVVSVREEQPPGTEVVRIRAIDRDNGYNASVTYSILKGRDSDGYGIFTIDPVSGVIRTKTVLDHEERAIYRLAVAATDNGKPPKQTVRLLRVEVLDLNDNRPTFSSSSLVFRVREDVPVGFIVGSVATNDPSSENNIVQGNGGSGHITYSLTSLSTDKIPDAFDMDRNTGSLVVARQLDRETQSEYQLEIRALDTSAMNNPQSSAVTVRVDIDDVNDNSPKWIQDPIVIPIPENIPVGSSIYNFTATDSDSGSNGDIRYLLEKQFPNDTVTFAVDPLVGTLTLLAPLDYETLPEYTLIVIAMDQSTNISERLSTSVTARLVITDSNDNVPKFVLPPTKNLIISDSVTVGMTLCYVVAVDYDSGDNGRVTYVITSGNEDSKFALDYDTGMLALSRSLMNIIHGSDRTSFDLNITASDHGIPVSKHSSMLLKVIVQDSKVNPPRFTSPVYNANISEDAPPGSFVVKVMAKSSLPSGGNLSYEIPAGIANDRFSMDPIRGIVTTKAILDREIQDQYTIPIYVIDNGLMPQSSPSGSSAKNSGNSETTQFDVATLVVTVTDVNDHAPEFKPGACYPLSIPENSETAVVHTVVATDMDIGPNADISYTITGGNTGNKFTINPHTGELSARPLDRETHSRYWLTVMAQDHGSPIFLQGSCNISIHVEDQNDNDPIFDRSRYSATIPEDISIDSSVLTVHASDIDIGVNARIIYSLANESDWLFRIDNKTGIITTAGSFDREKKSSYNFDIVATDGGRYNARSQKVPIEIIITDVNDNRPIFSEYPFRKQIPAYTQPGQTLIKVFAHDADEGINAEILYTLSNEDINSKFRINPNTGILTASRSLASENGKIIRIELVARDKGNPPQSSVGLIELTIGDIPENIPTLRFQNISYNVSLLENSYTGKEVVKVSAVRSDGRKQNTQYKLGNGNEDNIFEINSDTGVIRVKNSKLLDYEYKSKMRFTIVAQSDGNPQIFGYSELVINLIDENDNSPRFTQQQYNSAVWEGKHKGTFVIQVMASDADQGSNSKLLYHIVDGNHDNAFVIEPAFSGIVKTNIVLDREIRDTYRLTVIATDEGVPQMTGTTTIRINIVDVNDNRPTFPPHSIITISEGTEVGTVLTSVTANDVDTNPTLTYAFANNVDNDAKSLFTIDRYSGKIILRRHLDYETRQEYSLRVTASDTAHLANTTLTIRVTDVNDNAPVFQQPAYHAILPEDVFNSNIEVLIVNATDADSEENAVVKYSLLKQTPGFFVDPISGAVFFNHSYINAGFSQEIQLIIVATDSGKPPLSSLAPVRIQVNSATRSGSNTSRNNIRVKMNESAKRGSIVTRLAANNRESITNQNYYIVDGNEDGIFEIGNPGGVVILMKSLDRETQDSYSLRVVSDDRTGVRHHDSNVTGILVYVSVEDANDNAPVFQKSNYDTSISEDTSIGSSVVQVLATDADLEGHRNSDVTYDITSGNDFYLFRIDPNSGIIFVNQSLDYDTGIYDNTLIVRACDNGETPLCTLAPVSINLEDENDNAPHFPVTEYLEFVGENEPIGTVIFTARATDLDKGKYGILNYTIESAGGYSDIDEAWKQFKVDPLTGLVVTSTVFDYEQKSRYTFSLKATDIGGKSASVRVRIEIDSRDEFHPQFTERTYHFTLATSPNGNLPVGYIVGHVTATDRDKGPDGRVVYQLTTQHPYFKMNRTTGAVMIKKKLDNAGVTLEAGRDISLVITASSGRQGSLTNMTVVEIVLDPLAEPGTNIAIHGNNTTVSASGNGIADWAVGLLISLIIIVLTFGAVFLFLHMRNRRHKKVNKPNLNADNVANANNYVDPSAFDTIPVRGGGSVVVNPGNQFAPPKYDEIPPYGAAHPASSNSGAPTTSELSGSEQSGSSGRGSAEDDGEDEEIRMINEGPLQRDSGIHRQNDDDDDNISDVSVHNTQEYLARLGIVDTTATSSASTTAARLCSEALGSATTKETLMHHQIPMDSLRIFDEEGTADPDLTNLIYAKLNDVNGSDHASSTDDGGAASAVSLGNGIDHVMMSTLTDVPGVSGTHHQPSMNGSLSSIVHSEEELTGSYNWDYLLDWGPQYQPLAHVFSEIARLKDDTGSVESANSGTSSIKSKNSSVHPPVIKNIPPPPHLTNVAPRSIPMPILSSRATAAGSTSSSSHHTNTMSGGSVTGSGHGQMLLMPRSPISHDASGTGFSTSTAMSPSFSPSLSPLATKSPSISPLVTPGLPTAHHVVSLPRQQGQSRGKTTIDTELRI